MVTSVLTSKAAVTPVDKSLITDSSLALTDLYFCVCVCVYFVLWAAGAPLPAILTMIFEYYNNNNNNFHYHNKDDDDDDDNIIIMLLLLK